MRSVLVAAGAAVLLVVLAGCDEPPPHVTPVPTPSVTTVFASDEEALAAAEEAYRAYLAVADQIFAEGGADPERLSAVAAPPQLTVDLQGFEEVVEEGQHSVGLTTFRDIALQRYDPTVSEDTIIVYLCEDVSGVDVLDRHGSSLVTPSRPNLVTYQVSFGFDFQANQLMVSDKEAWSASCE